jgi:hypothetical protein
MFGHSFELRLPPYYVCRGNGYFFQRKISYPYTKQLRRRTRSERYDFLSTRPGAMHIVRFPFEAQGETIDRQPGRKKRGVRLLTETLPKSHTRSVHERVYREHCRREGCAERAIAHRALLDRLLGLALPLCGVFRSIGALTFSSWWFEHSQYHPPAYQRIILGAEICPIPIKSPILYYQPLSVIVKCPVFLKYKSGISRLEPRFDRCTRPPNVARRTAESALVSGVIAVPTADIVLACWSHCRPGTRSNQTNREP